MNNKAFFLDRDGVLIEDGDYLFESEKVRILPGTVPALQKIHESGYLAVVVTNQSGVARGIFSEDDIRRVHEHIDRELRARGVRIDAFYYCPHHQDITGVCACRKPAPGMLLAAAGDLDIDVGRSAMVGDRPGDIAAGNAAGCRQSYLVRTGYGAEYEKSGRAQGLRVVDDLPAAVDDFLNLMKPEAGR